MLESMGSLKRSHMCGAVNEKNVGETVTIAGWVNKKRDFNQLIFLLIRDREGVVQVVVDNDRVSDELWEKVQNVKGEYVLAVKGKVIERTKENINESMKTGKIEIEAEDIKILSKAETPPFQVADENVNEEMRLKYRYIDMRRQKLQDNLYTRHKAAQSTRNFLSGEGFIEVETPILANSSPEGARDYLTPSRIHKGCFYALPQSPQIFKQLLMAGGIDKYYQIAKCFRDEDLRADRQPEFTQIDMEMSFVDIEDVLSIGERLIAKIFKDVLGHEVKTPIKRMPYDEAMERFGSDKPDLRFGMELVNISDMVADTDFVIFKSAIESGGSVRGINAKNCSSFSRKQIDSLVDYAKIFGAKGLAWITINENGEAKTTLSKFFDDEKISEIINKFGGENGDLILLCADKNSVVFDVLGNLRQEIARRTDLFEDGVYEFVWITDFPLFEWDEEEGRFFAAHHPFTSPVDEDLDLVDSKPEKVRAKAYDMVLNGFELGGGSIRIHREDIQQKMFKALGFTKEKATESFGHLLEAFKYGFPPHGGIAFGFDRIVMLLTGAEAIRDVIAFPKAKNASCPLTGAPAAVEESQLDELGIKIK